MLSISLTMKHDKAEAENNLKATLGMFENTSNDSSIASQIEKLKELHENGDLTDEQYNAAIDKLVK